MANWRVYSEFVEISHYMHALQRWSKFAFVILIRTCVFNSFTRTFDFVVSYIEA